MRRPLSMHLSARCGAKTRRGTPCGAGAMVNGRCRMHGGASPGAPRGARNGNYKHGLYTMEAMERRRAISDHLKASRQLLRRLDWPGTS